MKLRNKQTGEIGYLYEHSLTQDIIIVYDVKGIVGKYTSLAKLNEEWEDVPEEPKDNNYWYIDNLGRIHFSSEVIDEVEGHPNNWMIRKQFGNYFSSWNEAEQAVEKLKAWKRLKDKGISYEAKVIDGKWYLAPKAEPQHRTFDEAHDVFKDIIFIFGGEE